MKIDENDHDIPESSALAEDKNTDDPKPNSPRFLARFCAGTTTVLRAVLKGIPPEIAFVVTPAQKEELLCEYHCVLEELPSRHVIKVQVQLMQLLLQKHFPDLKAGSLQWMHVRSYFFGKIGLWGKFG